MAFNSIKAETFYSEYSAYSPFTEEMISPSDTTKIKTERRYRWYKEEKILGDYHPIASSIPNYPEIDLDDFYETSFSDWREEIPEFKTGRVVETRDIYAYKDRILSRYAHLKGNYTGNLSFNELEFYYNDEKIDYEILNENDFGRRLHDGNYNDNFNTALSSNLVIDLKNYYSPKYLIIKAYFYNSVDEKNRIEIKFTSESRFYSDCYGLLSTDVNPVKFNQGLWTYSYPNYLIEKAKYTDTMYSLTMPESREDRIIDLVKQYRYKDTLYRYFQINRKYLDGYYKDNPGDYIKDEDKYRDYYSYKTRDKVVISDNLEFKDYHRSLNDLILDTTTNDITIKSKFNIYKNGTYKVEFILPFKTIVKNVKVNILQNSINEVNDKLLLVSNQSKKAKVDLSNSKDKLEKLKAKLKKLENEDADMEIINKYKKEISDLENHIDSLIVKIDKLEKKKKSYNDKLDSLIKQKQKNNYNFINSFYSFIWLIIIVVLGLISYFVIKMKKMSYQN